MASEKKRKKSMTERLFPISRAFFLVLVKWFIATIRTTGLLEINASTKGMVVVANHQSDFDPFLANVLVKRQFRYLMSDSNLRSWVGNLLFSKVLGVIPKSKGVNDTRSIRKAQRVLQQGGVVGIFVEGQCTWDGAPLPLIPSIGKLIKIFKVPVFSAQIIGSHYLLPRWGAKRSKGVVTINYQNIITATQAHELTAQQMTDRITDALNIDTHAHQLSHHYWYGGSNRAEYVERFIFMCPSCGGVETVFSHYNTIICKCCGELAVYNGFRLLQFHQHHRTQFINVAQWNKWQIERWKAVLATVPLGASAGTDSPNVSNVASSPSAATSATKSVETAANESGALSGETSKKSSMPTSASIVGLLNEGNPILFQPQVELKVGYRDGLLESNGVGSLSLFPRAVCWSGQNNVVNIPLSEIVGVNVQHGELLEFYWQATMYQCEICKINRNSYLWMITIQFFQERLALEMQRDSER